MVRSVTVPLQEIQQASAGADETRRPRSIEWLDGAVVVVDQTVLPHVHRRIKLKTVDEVVDAIARMAVRGAPAIGVAGALGVALSAAVHEGTPAGDPAVRRDADRLIEARPTAVNLEWGVRRALSRLAEGSAAVLSEARTMLDEDERINVAAAGRAAALLLELCGDRALRVATHCNTGRLATISEGTALGAIKLLALRDRVTSVLVGETRPLLQGARLTTWELAEAGIAHRLCVDSALPAAIAGGMVDCVVVGADRVAANGDVANKIGTYGLAVVAARHGVPFVVVAPESSIDRMLPDGSSIVIEERPDIEVLEVAGQRIAPAGTSAYNPAFDVTPAALITAVVSEVAVYESEIADGPRLQSDAAVTRRTDALAPLRDELVAAVHDLYGRGWMEGTSGNVSLRLGEDAALITTSGRGKGRLTVHDTVLVGVPGGEPRAPGSRPSAETAIHVALYARLPACGAVVHAHCPSATAFASRFGPSKSVIGATIAGYELIKGLGLDDPLPREVVLPVFPNWPDVARIAADVGAHLDAGGGPHPPALLIARHGATAWGVDIHQARDRLECLEALCRLVLLAEPGATALG